MNVILCGLPMSGKSHFAKLAAEKFGLAYMDTDFLIEQFYKMMYATELKCSDIYKRHGGDYFRMLERSAVNSLASCKNCVIAIGGGSVLAHENVKVLKEIGKLIYLKANTEVLFNRLRARENKPAYLDEQDFKASFEKIAEERTKIYEAICDVTIDTDKLSAEQVIDSIEKVFKDALKERSQ